MSGFFEMPAASFDPFADAEESGKSFDPLADADGVVNSFNPFAGSDKFGKAVKEEKIHLRVQQRNGKKCVTSIQGLKHEHLAKGFRKDFSKSAAAKNLSPEDYGLDSLLKSLKKEFCCNGVVVVDSELGKVIQLQGDQRKKVSKLLVDCGFVSKDDIKIHGF